MFKSLKNVRNLTALGMFIALSMVASNYLSFHLGFNHKFGLTFIVTALMCSVFDMPIAVLAAIVIDVVGNTLSPPPGGFYAPFITTKIAAAIIYCFFFHRKNIRIVDVIGATVLNTLITSMFLNTYWLARLLGTPFLPQFLTRVSTSLINFTFHTIVLVIITKPVIMLVRNELKKNGVGDFNYYDERNVGKYFVGFVVLVAVCAVGAIAPDYIRENKVNQKFETLMTQAGLESEIANYKIKYSKDNKDEIKMIHKNKKSLDKYEEYSFDLNKDELVKHLYEKPQGKEKAEEIGTEIVELNK